MSLATLAILTVTMVTIAVTSSAQETTTERIRLMTAARDVCASVIAKFANSPDPDSEITYDQGKFKVIRSKGGVTVLENNVKLADLPKFDYGNYQECLAKMIGNNH